MSHDPVSEMYALWERYKRLRAIGSQKLRKQANQSLNTFIECFKQQTGEVRATFVNEIYTLIWDAITNAPDEFWLLGGHLFDINLPIPLQVPFTEEVLTPELNRRLQTDPNDAQALRWRGLYKQSYAIQKDQMTLRHIIMTYMYSIGYTYGHDVEAGIISNPSGMNAMKVTEQNLAEARDYWVQLESSTLKDKWDKCLTRYERIAACWDDYCSHKFLNDVFYNDFHHYLIVNKIW